CCPPSPAQAPGHAPLPAAWTARRTPSSHPPLPTRPTRPATPRRAGEAPARRPPMHELEGGGFGGAGGGANAVGPAPRGRMSDLRFQIQNLTRVEGEGSLHLLVRDGAVAEARLQIFEAPRYFEAIVAGRTPNEVIDIVSRICGICPVAYQMSAVHAFEDLFGVEVEPAT